MAYADEGMSTNRMIALGLVALLHVFLGYAFITGLALKAVKAIVNPLESVNIEEEAPPPDEPPPPPPKDVDIPPFVPPPAVPRPRRSPGPQRSIGGRGSTRPGLRTEPPGMRSTAPLNGSRRRDPHRVRARPSRGM
jgi:protein TonB